MTQFRRGNISNARATPTQVRRIRELYSQGWTQGKLSRHFRLSVGQIGRICRGEAWQQYDQPVHPDEIEHSQASLPDAPVEHIPILDLGPLSQEAQEAIEKFMKGEITPDDTTKPKEPK